MGMTIDKSILYMSLYKQRLEESISDGLEEDIEAYELCIETMRKYKKIYEILRHWNDTGGSAEEADILNEIEEVLEDGNNSR